MPRAFTLLAPLIAAALLPAAPAAGKGIVGLTVCGVRHHCVDRTAWLGRGRHREAVLDVGPRVAEQPPAPFLRLKLRQGDGGQTFGYTTVLFVPRTGLRQTADGSWYLADPPTLALLRHLVRGVAPLPASALAAAAPVPSGPPIPETVTPPIVDRRPVDAASPAPLIAGLAAVAALAAALALAVRYGRRRGRLGRAASR